MEPQNVKWKDQTNLTHKRMDAFKKNRREDQLNSFFITVIMLKYVLQLITFIEVTQGKERNICPWNEMIYVT